MMREKETSEGSHDKWRAKFSEWQEIIKDRKAIESKLALHRIKNKVVTVFRFRKK